MISALHNASRSLSVAVLAASDGMLVLFFVGGEFALFFLYKIARGDCWWWVRADRIFAIFNAFIVRFNVKVITDFSGCLHLLHSYEMGGIAFSASMVWAQIIPFVALQFFDGGMKETVTIILVCSATLWLL